MNCGLGNLVTLKQHLLQPADQAGTTYDALLRDLGRGVAGLMDTYCNRRFVRVEDETCQFSANRSHYILPRYPIESISLVEVRESLTTGWETRSDLLVNWNSRTGELEFEVPIGVRTEQVRITWTGGYWFDETEDSTGVMPVGSTLLMDELKLAWLQQTQFNFERRDIRQRKTAGIKDGEGMLKEIELLPQVLEILRPYRRMQLT